MPGCAVHFELALRVLRFWEDRPAGRPFLPYDPGARSAFLFGSLGPDLGYIPGGDGLLADLAHCVRPAHLARHLIAGAESNFDRALAWGWVTHVLGDIWIHPLINQAAGERICGDRFPGSTFADDPITHVRVELGLDAMLPVRGDWRDPGAPGGYNTSRKAVAPLVRAYQETYGFDASWTRMWLATHVAAGFIPMMLLAGRIVSGRPASLLASWVHRRVASFSRLICPDRLIDAVTNPLPPPDWLLAEASDVVDTFAERFQPYCATNLEGLLDYNLDTGQVEGAPPTYPLTIAALERLSQRNSRGAQLSPGVGGGHG
jgi:hypothetical protein